MQKAQAMDTEVELEKLLGLAKVADSLLNKLHRFVGLTDLCVFPKVNTHLQNTYPAHPLTHNWDKIDVKSMTRIQVTSDEDAMNALSPWYGLLEDVAMFYHHSTEVLWALSKQLTVFSLSINPSVVQAYLRLFSRTVKVMILSAATPARLLLQVYALVFHFYSTGAGQTGKQGAGAKWPVKAPLTPPRWPELVAFFSFTDAVPRLQEELAPCAGLVADALREDLRAVVLGLAALAPLRDGAFLSPLRGPAAPPPLPEGATWEHVAVLDEAAEWALLGLLVFPRAGAGRGVLELLQCLLHQNILVHLSREYSLFIHDQFLEHAQAGLAEALAATRPEVDVASFLAECKRVGMQSAGAVHGSRRVYAAQELARVEAFCRDEPARLARADAAPRLAAALALARQEVLWYFRHVGEVPGVPPDPGIIRLLSLTVTALRCVLPFLPSVRTAALSAVTRRASVLSGWMERHPLARLGARGQGLAPVVVSKVASLVAELRGAAQGLGEGAAEGTAARFRTVRRQWQALSLALSCRSAPSSLAHLLQACSAADSSGYNLVEEMNRCCEDTRLVDEAEEVLREAASLAAVLDLLPKVRECVNDALVAPSHLVGHVVDAVHVLAAAAAGGPEPPAPGTPDLKAEVEALLRGVSDRVLELVITLQGPRAMGALEDALHPTQGLARLRAGEDVVDKRGRSHSHSHGHSEQDPLKGAASALPGGESHYSRRAQVLDLEAATARLASLCAGLRGLPLVVRVGPGTAISPLAPVRAALLDGFREYLYSRLMHAVPVPEAASADPPAVLILPSRLEGMLQRWASVLLRVEQWCGVDTQTILRQVLVEEAQSRPRGGAGAGAGAGQEGAAQGPGSPWAGARTLVMHIAAWYLETIALGDFAPYTLLYSGTQQAFVSSKAEGKAGGKAGAGAARPAWWARMIGSFTDPPELDALARVFGPQAAEAFAQAMLPPLEERVGRLGNMLVENAEALLEMEGQAHDGPACSQVAARLTHLDEAIAVLVDIGKLLALLKLVVGASARQLQGSAPVLQRLVALLHARPRRPPGPAADHAPAAAELDRALAKLWGHGATPKAAAALAERFLASALQAMVEQEYGEGCWQLLPVLYAATLTRPIWEASQYHSADRALSNNLHCGLDAMLALLAAVATLQGAPSEPDSDTASPAHEMMEVFVKCASAVLPPSAAACQTRGCVMELLATSHCTVQLDRKLLHAHIPYAVTRRCYMSSAS